MRSRRMSMTTICSMERWCSMDGGGDVDVYPCSPSPMMMTIMTMTAKMMLTMRMTTMRMMTTLVTMMTTTMTMIKPMTMIMMATLVITLMMFQQAATTSPLVLSSSTEKHLDSFWFPPLKVL